MKIIQWSVTQCTGRPRSDFGAGTARCNYWRMCAKSVWCVQPLYAHNLGGMVQQNSKKMIDNDWTTFDFTLILFFSIDFIVLKMFLLKKTSQNQWHTKNTRKKTNNAVFCINFNMLLHYSFNKYFTKAKDISEGICTILNIWFLCKFQCSPNEKVHYMHQSRQIAWTMKKQKTNCLLWSNF